MSVFYLLCWHEETDPTESSLRLFFSAQDVIHCRDEKGSFSSLNLGVFMERE